MQILRNWGYLIVVLLAFTAHAQSPSVASAPSSQTISASPNQAGSIVLSEGDARILVTGAAARPTKVGDVVSEGDTLITGKDGEIHLDMRDTGFIALRPNTRFTVVSYKADGGNDDKGVFRLVAGGFRSVTGWIGKFNPRAYKVKTPTATIGIRGTDHEPRYIPEGSGEGEAGTYDRVFVGTSFIETPAGKASIAPNQAGFVSVRAKDRPRLLAGIPVFFKPSPHEAEIAAKHLDIQRVINQRRDERRQILKQKREELKAEQRDAQALLKRNNEAAKEQKASAEQQRLEMKEKREALRADTKAATDAMKAVKAKRKALLEDVDAGRVKPRELRERRKVLREETEAAERAMRDVEARQKTLADQSDDNVQAQTQATIDRLKAAQDKRKSVRDKRGEVETERDSAREEIKGLQQQENQRFREQLKADRKPGAPARTPDEPKSQ